MFYDPQTEKKTCLCCIRISLSPDQLKNTPFSRILSEKNTPFSTEIADFEVQ